MTSPPLSGRLRRFIGSPRFFYAVVALLVFQALWFVFSAVYPMAFDEDFHLGIIQIYAGQWLPFLSGQPDGADAYGAVARDTSYLFHYIMSFPYRLVRLFTDNQTVAVIILRLLNVALFVAALLLWRRVLAAARLSPALANLVLLLFVLIPIVPQLAGQINYDNLLLLLMAWFCLLAADMLARLRQGEFPLRQALLLAIVGLFSSLVKYAFLPVFTAAAVFVAVYAWRQLRARGAGFGQMAAGAWTGMGRTAQIGLAGLLLLAGGLAFERYGVNLVAYKDPIPDCGKVLPTEQCLQYGPWGRDYRLAQAKGEVDANPIIYLGRWLYGMGYRLFFAVNGNVPAPARYQNFPPLPVVALAAVLLALAGLAAAARHWRAIRGRPLLLFFAVITVVYCAVLWLQNYQMYLTTGQAVAVNGRYLLLVMLPAAAVAGFALSRILRARPRLANTLAAAAVLAFLQGGLFTFWVRSNDAWYWPNDTVKAANHAAQRLARPVAIGKDMRWPSP